MAERRIVYLVALVGSIIFYLLYQKWLSWVVLMAVLWLPALSLVLSLPAMVLTKVKLVCPRTVPMGEEARVKLSSSCSLPLPLITVKLQLRHSPSGGIQTMKQPGLLPTNHCGIIEISAKKCYVYDYLGLFRRRVRQPLQESLAVMPLPVPQPEPDLTTLYARAWRPKAGGGFSENHELRLYRPGDSLQQIHWKLTAKTGKLIIREAMEQLHGRVLVTMDLLGTPEEVDRKLGQLLWLSRFLLRQEIPHELRVLTGDGILAEPVTTEQELEQALIRLMGMPCGDGFNTIRNRHDAASRIFYVGGGTDAAQ